MTPPHHTTVRDATSSDMSTLAITLASAFADDPLMGWLLGRTDRPEERLVPVFRAMATTALHETGGDVHVTADGEAVAIWRDVGCWKASAGHLARVMPGMIRSFRWRAALLLRGLAKVERVHPDEPHRYLACLGTHRDAQGEGLGSAVLGRMLARCDEDGIPVYAESSNPQNLAFYYRHGFVRYGDEVRPGHDAPPVFPIWRDPR
jgi:ribosomal protein S18 acetylase RimI-like enzyme